MPVRAAPKWMVRSAWILAFAWPLSIHRAILLGAPEWGPRLTALAAVLGLLLWAAASRRAWAFALAAAIAGVLGGLAFAANVRSAGLFARK